MPIQALPATSIRALGSGQVLTDSLALIKELLDNSLDAFATQISIEVSQNALDTIQVRDNGHGIPEEDRDAMALRYCTSKIRDFSDIQDCRSLGFRGEALASAAELAGGLTITTRVEGERIATACTCDRAGRVVDRKPVSAPLGTTVRVTDFFKHLPVRRENAVKGASKVLGRLRTLVQKYYLSHPNCRLSLRILASLQKGGAKGRNEDIVYAPSKSVQEAVQKAVGKDVATACEWVDTSSAAYAETLAEDYDAEDEGNDSIVLEAFLPKPKTDPTVISKKPQCTHFIFVDSRSVSCARGTLKQVHTLYKSYLKSASSASGFSDPFIYLNIRCPPGTYDPNIEPAKDDVLFYNGDAMIKNAERMLKRFYGELKVEERVGKAKVSEVTKVNGFELLLARKPKVTPTPKPPKENWPKLVPARPRDRADNDGVDEDEEAMAAMAIDIVMGSGEFGGIDRVGPTRWGQKEAEPGTSNQADEDQPMLPVEDDPIPLIHIEDPNKTDRPPMPPEPEPGTAVPVTANTTNLTTPKRKLTNWGFNMSGGLDEDDDEPVDEELEHPSDNEEAVRRDITLSNPWTTAKMNAPIVSSPIMSSPSLPPPVARSSLRKPFKPPTLSHQGSSSVSPENASGSFPTPAPSSPGARLFRENRGSVVRKARSERSERPEKSKSSRVSAGVMDSFVSRGSRRGERDSDKEEDRGEREGETENVQVKSKGRGFVSAAKIYKERIEDLQNDEDHDKDHRHQQRQKCPVRVRETTKRTKASGEASKRRRLEPELQENDPTPIDLDSYDLGPAPARPSPHKNRFLAATAALSVSAPAPEPVLSDDLNLLPPPEERRPKRRRTRTLLPLDSVPEPYLQTHSITKTVDLVTGGKLKNMFIGLRGSDEYVGGTATGIAAEGGKEVDGMFFSESARWDDLDALAGLLKGWLLGVAETVDKKLVEDVQGIKWEWREGGEEGERIVWAVGSGRDVEEGTQIE